MLSLPLLVALMAQAPATPEEPAAPVDAFAPDPGWKALGPSLWFDPKERRLVIRARVSLREGWLEHLLCLKNSKEHESVLATEAPPVQIHAGLLLTGAETGHPVRFQPKFEPPTGTPIDIQLSWRDARGELHQDDARDWIKDEKSGKTMEKHWVFAGSDTFRDPQTNRVIYAANSGDLITVSNFMSAILDVPYASSASDAERSYVANTDRIPPRETPVTMYLRPVREPKSGPATKDEAATP